MNRAVSIVALGVILLFGSSARAEPVAAEPVKPVFLTFTCPVRFEVWNGEHRLSLDEPNDGHTHRFLWELKEGPEAIRPVPFDLVAGEIYTFTIGIWSRRQEILVVEKDGRTLLDRRICEVHQVPLDLKEVPIGYGRAVLTAGRLSYVEAQTRFPHRLERLNGGCAGGGFGPKTGYRYVCPECVAGFKALNNSR